MLVYKAKFPNGKVYIGKSKNFLNRIKKHKSSDRYYDTKMANAISKFGFDNITWEVIFESDDVNIVNQKEKEFIIFFDSIENGYNISTGGDGGDTISNNPHKNDIMRKQLKSKGIDGYTIIDENLSNLIIKDYQENFIGIRTLSKKYNISRQRLSRFFQSNKILIDKDRTSKVNTFIPSTELIDRIIKNFKEGKTIKEMSEEENLTILLVSRILHDSGVRKSKRFKDGKRYDGRQPKNRKHDNQIG